MNLKDLLEVSATALASLGGGGAIIYGFSGYLGKLWADRSLEDMRHKYTQMNIKLQGDFDSASRRLQAGLDSLGLVHRLRTEGEFNRLAGLWKRVADLRNYFNQIAGTGLNLGFADKEKQERAQEEARCNFDVCLNEAQRFLEQEMLFIPKEIADAAQKALTDATLEQFNFSGFRPHLGIGGDMYPRYAKMRREYFLSFSEAARDLEAKMRLHIAGQEAQVSAPPETQ